MAITNSPSIANQRLRGQLNKNGGTPEDARHGVLTMEAVAEMQRGGKARIGEDIGIAPPRGKGKGIEIGIATSKLMEAAYPIEQGYIDQARDREEPFAVAMTITPEVAARLLARNEGNRPVSKRKILEYTADLRAGRFAGMNGETIIISREGLLNNGQHRLLAIIESSTALRTLVVFGAERSTIETLDLGKRRTIPDFLGMFDYPHPKVFAAAANIGHAFDHGQLRGTDTEETPMLHGNARASMKFVTPAELLDYAEKNYTAIAWSVEAIKHEGVTDLGGRPRLAAACYLVARENEDALDEVRMFFDMLRTGRDGEGNILASGTVQTLRKKLTALRKFKPSHFTTLLYIIKAWNAYAAGEELAYFKFEKTIPPVRKFGCA